jgi:hypothetical protein
MSNYGPKVTSLAGTPVPVTKEDRARAIWLLRRYSSLTYIRRMSALFANFVGGYEEFSRKDKERPDFHLENLATFYAERASLQQGLDKVERGYSIGYASILEGCDFLSYLGGRRFEGGFENEEIGWNRDGAHTGLYAWADVAMGMAAQVRRTLNGSWAFPAILESGAKAPPTPHASALAVGAATGGSVYTGEAVPTTGIWQPKLTPSGCPNFFISGLIAPRGSYANERLDYPAFPGKNGLEPPYTMYDYGADATLWDLIWTDRRYEGGRAPALDEEAFLGADTEPPPWPPVQPVGEPS